jgi:hypothetical protein
MKEFPLGDGKVLVVNHNGQFSAVGNKCTHLGASLVKGVCRTKLSDDNFEYNMSMKSLFFIIRPFVKVEFVVHGMGLLLTVPQETLKIFQDLILSLVTKYCTSTQ